MATSEPELSFGPEDDFLDPAQTYGQSPISKAYPAFKAQQAVVGSFEKFAFPMIKRVYPQLVHQSVNQMITAQPMQAPASKIFYQSFEYPQPEPLPMCRCGRPEEEHPRGGLIVLKTGCSRYTVGRESMSGKVIIISCDYKKSGVMA